MQDKHSNANTQIGIPNDDRFEDDEEILPGWQIPIADYFDDVGVTSLYEYDYGDSWIHQVVLEGILLKEKGQKYPRCIAGARACPPEDCGGIPGFQDLLKIIANPKNEEHDETITWLVGQYDPAEFNPQKVKLTIPASVGRLLFQKNRGCGKSIFVQKSNKKTITYEWKFTPTKNFFQTHELLNRCPGCQCVSAAPDPYKKSVSLIL